MKVNGKTSNYSKIVSDRS